MSEEPAPPDSPPLSFTGTCEENGSRGEGGWERTEPGTNWHRERTDEWIQDGKLFHKEAQSDGTAL